jgi:hypothetical protein
MTCGTVYPRNPWGRGYRKERNGEDWALPALEDPRDPLEPRRLEGMVEGSWKRGPLPWCLDDMHPLAFPRAVMVAGLAELANLDTSVTEVDCGFLQLPIDTSQMADPRFLQDAPPWAWLGSVARGTEVVVKGCRPRRESFSATIPEAPPLSLIIEGSRQDVEFRLTKLYLCPEQGEVFASWSAEALLPRVYIPGLHKRIPITVDWPGHGTFDYPVAPASRPPLPSVA